MRVKPGESWAQNRGQVSLVSPRFHPQRVKGEMRVNIYRTTLSLLLSLFHPYVCANHYFGPFSRTRGGGERKRENYITGTKVLPVIFGPKTGKNDRHIDIGQYVIGTTPCK